MLNVDTFRALGCLKSLGPLLVLAQWNVIKVRIVLETAHKNILEVHVVMLEMASFHADGESNNRLQNNAPSFLKRHVNGGLFKGVACEIENEVAESTVNVGRLLADKVRNACTQMLRDNFSNRRFIEKFVAKSETCRPVARFCKLTKDLGNFRNLRNIFLGMCVDGRPFAYLALGSVRVDNDAAIGSSERLHF